MGTKNRIRELSRQLPLVVLLVVMVLGSASLLAARRTVDAKTAEAEEAARPANVDIIAITDPDCETCFDLNGMLSYIEGGPFAIGNRIEYAYDSPEAAQFIDDLGIERVPTVVVRGEVKKENAWTFLEQGMRIIGDSATPAVIPPVYRDVASGAIVGEVGLTLLDDASCDECYDPALLMNLLRNNFGIAFTDIVTHDVAAPEGRMLVAEYGVSAVPTVVMRGDTAAYTPLVQSWSQVGSIEDDGVHVFRRPDALGVAYRDLTTGEVIIPGANN